ncbi:GAF domain-containing protein [Methylobacterium sp. 2A]|nr:GAF domain-containing protein [Methylobacterium sp. 2A]
MAQMELRRALAEQRRLLDRSEELIRTQAAMSVAKGDIGAMLDALVVGAMVAVPHAEGAVIETLDGEELVYRATKGVLVVHAGLRLPLRNSLAGACLLSGEPILVPDVLEDPRVKRDLVASLRLRSCALVPVRRAGEAIGVLKLIKPAQRLHRLGPQAGPGSRRHRVGRPRRDRRGRCPARGRDPAAPGARGWRRRRVRQRAGRHPARLARVLPSLRPASARQLPLHGLRAPHHPRGCAPHLDGGNAAERSGPAGRGVPHPPARHGGTAMDRPQGRARIR